MADVPKPNILENEDAEDTSKPDNPQPSTPSRSATESLLKPDKVVNQEGPRSTKELSRVSANGGREAGRPPDPTVVTSGGIASNNPSEAPYATAAWLQEDRRNMADVSKPSGPASDTSNPDSPRSTTENLVKPDNLVNQDSPRSVNQDGPRNKGWSRIKASLGREAGRPPDPTVVTSGGIASNRSSSNCELHHVHVLDATVATSSGIASKRKTSKGCSNLELQHVHERLDSIHSAIANMHKDLLSGWPPQGGTLVARPEEKDCLLSQALLKNTQRNSYGKNVAFQGPALGTSAAKGERPVLISSAMTSNPILGQAKRRPTLGGDAPFNREISGISGGMSRQVTGSDESLSGETSSGLSHQIKGGFPKRRQSKVEVVSSRRTSSVFSGCSDGVGFGDQAKRRQSKTYSSCSDGIGFGDQAKRRQSKTHIEEVRSTYSSSSGDQAWKIFDVSGSGDAFGCGDHAKLRQGISCMEEGGSRRPSTGSDSSASGTPSGRERATSILHPSLAGLPGLEALALAVLPNLVENDKECEEEPDKSEESSSDEENEEVDGDKAAVWAYRMAVRRHPSLLDEVTQEKIVSAGKVMFRRNPTCSSSAAGPVGPWWYQFYQRPELCMLKPESRIRIGWEMVMISCSLLLGIILPIELSYLDGKTLPYSVNALNIVVDVLLFLDIWLSFTMTWLDPTSLLFANPCQVARRYVQTWFCVDFVAAWPRGFHDKLAIGKVFRLLKLVKVTKFFVFISNSEEQLHSKVLSWAKIYVPLAMLIHLLACGWKSIKQSDYSTSANEEEYITDVYWVTMTMTTVGFGDIVPTHSSGRLYACAVMVLSSLFSGSVIALVTQAFKYYLDDEVEQHIREASKFMRKRRVSAEILKRVQHGLRRTMRQERSLGGASKILAHLSPSAQRDLSLEFLRTCFMSFPLFQNLPENLLAQLAQVHSWMQANAGDLVVEDGQVEEELVFVLQGALLRVTRTEKTQSVDISEETPDVEPEAVVKQDILGKGAWFGERCLFGSDHIRNCTVIADIDSELAVLSASTYSRVLRLYPDFYEQQQELIKLVGENMLSLQDLAYKCSEKLPT